MTCSVRFWSTIKWFCFLYDIQWMDQTSIQLLNRLLLTFGTHKILLMCTFNQEKDADVMESLNNIVKKGWLHVINLFPFNEKETNEILCKFLPELSEIKRTTECIPHDRRKCIFPDGIH